MPASSRVNPLLHGTHCPCRSGFTREEGGTGRAKPPGTKKAPREVLFVCQQSALSASCFLAGAVGWQSVLP
ncbi:hypothetical protein CBP05_02995 [Pseudomonas putida]|nr:hypothetical protein CBP05_02995 [Pseudomonas putida]OUS90777.1 hypothetical protein CBP06_01915 [Pseudomonas putida]